MEKLKHKHREGKMVVLENGELKIKSTELVDIINDFRKVESETTGRTYIELAHYDFYKKIKREVAILKSLCLGGDGNISESTYINSQNKVQPCFELNRDGMLQMLNSESALVRYKTIEYINKLEEQVKGQALNTAKLSKELQAILMLDNKTLELEKRLEKTNNKFDELPLFMSDSKALKKIANRVVVELLGGKQAPAYEPMSKKVFSDLYRQVHREFQISAVEEIKRKDLELAKEIISEYRLPIALKNEVELLNNQINLNI